MAKPAKARRADALKVHGAPGGIDGERIELAVDAAGQIEVLSNQLLHHANEGMEEMDTGESAIIIRALAGRCSSLACAAVALLHAEDKHIREDIEAIQKEVSHG